MTLLHERIIDRLDPDELVDILGIDIETLVDILYTEISENENKFYFLLDRDEEDTDGNE